MHDGSKYDVFCRLYNVFRTAMHTVFDGPLPIGIIHAYMNSIEEEMNDLVVRLLIKFLEIQRTNQGDTSMPAYVS